jgi:serine phosphatase RsbU (regulator of sigma subunit)
MQRALPFVTMAAIGAARLAFGPTWALLPLLVIGPAMAAAAGGLVTTLAAGGMAMGEDLMFVEMHRTVRSAEIALIAAAGVTVACLAACRAHQRRERELAQARAVAEAAQQAVLRPVPRQIGSVVMAARYLSASTGAHVGGDLYEVVETPGRVRLIVGDVEGKGLPAIQSAASVLGVFREAAHDDIDLPEIAARIEASLAREFGDEQFVTAVLADLTVADAKMDMLNCGHPAPALLGVGQPRFIGPDQCGLPLGLGQLTGAPRIPLTVPFEPGDRILFYTDGATEARNKAGKFFSLSESTSLCGCAVTDDPSVVVERLSDELCRYVGHEPDDDVALLLALRLATPAG